MGKLVIFVMDALAEFNLFHPCGCLLEPTLICA